MAWPTFWGAVGVAAGPDDGASDVDDAVRLPGVLVSESVALEPVDDGADEEELGALGGVVCTSLVDSTASSGPITRECPATTTFEPPTVAWVPSSVVTETSESSWVPTFTTVSVSAGVAPAG